MSEGWIRADWPAPAGIVAGTTLRSGGVSTDRYASLNLGAHVGDDDAAVRENRRRFGALCRLPTEPAWLRQVHGTSVLVAPAPQVPAEADAMVCREAGVVCVVMTADCLPVLFSAADGSEIAAAHAGWRGLSAGVLERTVSAMSTDSRSLMAWLGPAISQAAFEVGADVREEFTSRDPGTSDLFVANARGRWQADLYGLATRRLHQAGLRRVFGGDRCTHGEAGSFFSYRRDGACGRMATFIFRDAA